MLAEQETKGTDAPRACAGTPHFVLDAQKLVAYVGEYDLRGAAKYTVLLEDGKLKVITNNGKFELVAESETKFFRRESGTEIVFVKDGSGRVTEMVLNSSGQEIRLKKL